VRESGLRATSCDQPTFMSSLLEPPFGSRPAAHLPSFSARSGDAALASRLGRVTARVFADPKAHIGTTIELAGDELTGNRFAEKIGRATNQF